MESLYRQFLDSKGLTIKVDAALFETKEEAFPTNIEVPSELDEAARKFVQDLFKTHKACKEYNSPPHDILLIAGLSRLQLVYYEKYLATLFPWVDHCIAIRKKAYTISETLSKEILIEEFRSTPYDDLQPLSAFLEFDQSKARADGIVLGLTRHINSLIRIIKASIGIADILPNGTPAPAPTINEFLGFLADLFDIKYTQFQKILDWITSMLVQSCAGHPDDVLTYQSGMALIEEKFLWSITFSRFFTAREQTRKRLRKDAPDNFEIPHYAIHALAIDFPDDKKESFSPSINLLETREKNLVRACPYCYRCGQKVDTNECIQIDDLVVTRHVLFDCDTPPRWMHFDCLHSSALKAKYREDQILNARWMMRIKASLINITGILEHHHEKLGVLINSPRKSNRNVPCSLLLTSRLDSFPLVVNATNKPLWRMGGAPERDDSHPRTHDRGRPKKNKEQKGEAMDKKKSIMEHNDLEFAEECAKCYTGVPKEIFIAPSTKPNAKKSTNRSLPKIKLHLELANDVKVAKQIEKFERHVKSMITPPPPPLLCQAVQENEGRANDMISPPISAVPLPLYCETAHQIVSTDILPASYRTDNIAFGAIYNFTMPCEMHNCCCSAVELPVTADLPGPVRRYDQLFSANEWEIYQMIQNRWMDTTIQADWISHYASRGSDLPGMFFDAVDQNLVLRDSALIMLFGKFKEDYTSTLQMMPDGNIRRAECLFSQEIQFTENRSTSTPCCIDYRYPAREATNLTLPKQAQPCGVYDINLPEKDIELRTLRVANPYKMEPRKYVVCATKNGKYIWGTNQQLLPLVPETVKLSPIHRCSLCTSSFHESCCYAMNCPISDCIFSDKRCWFCPACRKIPLDVRNCSSCHRPFTFRVAPGSFEEPVEIQRSCLRCKIFLCTDCYNPRASGCSRCGGNLYQEDLLYGIYLGRAAINETLGLALSPCLMCARRVQPGVKPNELGQVLFYFRNERLDQRTKDYIYCPWYHELDDVRKLNGVFLDDPSVRFFVCNNERCIREALDSGVGFV